MLTKEDFIRHVLGEAPRTRARAAKKDTGHIEGFDFADDAGDSEATEDTRFVTPLLQAGFGDGQGIPRATVIRSTDAVAREIPDEVRYWPKTPTRPHHTLLIEAKLTHRKLLDIPAFKSRLVAHLDIVEDALARLVAEALEGFQRGAEGLDASALKGQKHETLCVVSIIDKREGHVGRLACFGTFNAKTEGLETFFLTDHTRTWDRADARERLELTYERQFRKLGEAAWQEAFTTTDERKQAEKLLEVCTKKNVDKRDIQESILDLLDTIAKGFGLRKKPNVERRLQAFPLPGEHDIGIDSEERESKYGGTNPFGGVTLRDERSRLLGYIVYPLGTSADAEKLRQHLKEFNRFHNVLVVYPDTNQASLELWQGRDQLAGKLRKGQSHKDAADVVNLLSRFFVVSKAKVRNPAELAQELAYRARYLRRLALKQLRDDPAEGQLRTLYSEFKKGLVHDLSEPDFADAFAQTLTYSLLTARWVRNAQGDAAPDRFSRKEAMKRLSVGSRFLAEMFDAVLAMELDDRGRLLWLVDDIADLLDRIDISSVFKPDGTDLTTDPVIHFYAPFLAAYDAKIRMQRGAFYTPQPVVSYIVRSAHELLQTEFGLADGLADTTTWDEMLKKHPGLKFPPLTDAPGENRTISPDEPFVQILDPATGTATFLVEVIDVIHRTLAAKWKQQRLTDAQQRAAWNDYVPKHLLPRLHAYELMMAPYAIAHMKIGLKLAETGYRFGTKERARIYLTNALEHWVKQLPLIGFGALAHEAAAVNEVKRHKRFTVVIGNPPYSNFGQLNKNPFILGLLEDYKRGLNERKLNLDDDFIKFVRFSQHLLDNAGVGVLGMITNNVFIDGITHRKMRESLLDSFSALQVFDLHGSAKKLEQSPDGSKDENVFDIQQGVGIFVFLKTQRRGQARVMRGDLWGVRERKYSALGGSGDEPKQWAEVCPSAPNYFFVVERSASQRQEYDSGWSTKAMFPVNNDGMQTKRDSLTIQFEEADVTTAVRDLKRLSDGDLRAKYDLPEDGRDWAVGWARNDVEQSKGFNALVAYRPFDMRHTFYTGRSKGFIAYPRVIISSHLVAGRCLGLAVNRFIKLDYIAHVFVVRSLVDTHLLETANSCLNVCPLYLFNEGSNELWQEQAKRPNLSQEFLKALSATLELKPSQPYGLPAGLTPEDIFHYAYAVFHSPGYRSRYAEFLKIDFPRLMLTGNLDLFHELARLGGELTALHLLESFKLAQPITEFIGGHHPEVETISWSRDTVWVDKAQTTGFRGVREEVWNFHIGGYQVCQKWLKDRKGRTLTKEDLAHYQKVVVALSETIRLMKEIDEIIEKHGGWPGAFVTKASA